MYKEDVLIITHTHIYYVWTFSQFLFSSFFIAGNTGIPSGQKKKTTKEILLDCTLAMMNVHEAILLHLYKPEKVKNN